MTRTSHRIGIPALVRHGFGAVQTVSPALAARAAERIFFTPPRRDDDAEIEGFLATGRRFVIPVNGGEVAGWRWGAGPVVYLAHGWGGRGGRFGSYIRPLVAAGFTAVAWDAPGHGASGRGMSSMPEFARALAAVVADQGPAHAIVAHSMGASATALAASLGVPAGRFAFLAPAANPASFAIPFARALGAAPEVMRRARARSERRLRFSWNDLDVPRMSERMSAPLLVVHDRQDQVVPFSDGERIAAAWPGARLLATEGLGHRGVIRDPGVVGEVVGFVRRIDG
ncbi:MAG TPA: alpha/beta fold hydrolase [Gemmatimonadales bacterium]|nr:alpha/beta fold hydrolase [Gemmatimonadales bacterium]